MKVLVVSDTHGVYGDLIDLINNEKFDMYIHLGDTLRDAEEIELACGIRFLKVKGNNDYFDFNTQENLIVDIAGKKTLLTHGHKDGVYFTTGNLLKRAKSLKADIVLFGHTHTFQAEVIDGVLLLNPGSTSFPRGGDLKRGCAVLKIAEDGEIQVERVEF